jgi:Rps23 Pro-64 3,4-dihydroxylase Tpa1-like proline 4-hydroxylase
VGDRLERHQESWRNQLAAFDRAALARAYRSAHPFPHIVIDDFLPGWMADELHREFPGPDHSVWTRLPTSDQRSKLVTTDEGLIPPLLRATLHELNSGSFLRFLEALTGIDALVADTKCVGGGLHQIERGGRLAVHIDYSHHPQNELYRRLNLLLYFNKDWRPEYKGELELWSPDVKRCEQKIAPLFNRCAIFSTSDISYHGHPEPLCCPEDMTRKSMSLYFFTKEPPAEKVGTRHNTIFRRRPGEPLDLMNLVIRAASSHAFREATPPVLYRALRGGWNRRFTGK